MAAPTLDAVFPNDADTNIPLGAGVTITFDQGVDLKSLKSSIVVYGSDFDLTSGPDSATWIRDDNNPFFLKSPGFSGTVEYKTTLVYVDDTGEEISSDTVFYTEEEAADYRHKLYIEPNDLFAQNTEYKVYIVGNSEGGLSKGISKRTIYAVDDTGATGDTGVVHIGGSYTGGVDDKIFVKITDAGNPGEAEYKYWYDGEGEGAATKGKVTSRRWRRLDDGVQIRFTGSSFEEDDVYTISLYKKEYLEDTYNFSFSTGSGSIVSLPSTTSTSVIGVETTSDTTSSYLEVSKMEPEDGATHVSVDKRKITITFSESIDETTVTEDTVAIYAYPASGRYGDGEVEQLSGKLTVDDNVLTIEL